MVINPTVNTKMKTNDIILYYKFFTIALIIVTIESLELIDGIGFGYDSDKLVRGLVRAVCYSAIIYFIMSAVAYKIGHTKI